MSKSQTTPAQVFTAVMDIEDSIGEISGLTNVLLEIVGHRGKDDPQMDYLVTELSVKVQDLESSFRAAFDAAARCHHA